VKECDYSRREGQMGRDAIIKNRARKCEGSPWRVTLYCKGRRGWWEPVVSTGEEVLETAEKSLNAG